MIYYNEVLASLSTFRLDIAESLYNGDKDISHFVHTIVYKSLLLKIAESRNIPVDYSCDVQNLSFPFEYKELPIELLGAIYERFLGDIITFDDNGKAKVKESSKARKEGGVYYTPITIVEYIVKETIGKKLEGKRPEDILDFTILDPACGSGIFLLEAYRYMLNWYGNSLSVQEKKDILTRHIYGVDIDKDAVNITKMSLMLIAGNITETYLENNIKVGNSLLDTF